MISSVETRVEFTVHFEREKSVAERAASVLTMNENSSSIEHALSEASVGHLQLTNSTLGRWTKV